MMYILSCVESKPVSLWSPICISDTPNTASHQEQSHADKANSASGYVSGYAE